MDYLVYIGAILAIAGLCGLGFCMAKAYKARQSNLEGEALTAHLRSLVSVNLISFFVSIIGLAMVVIGILL